MLRSSYHARRLTAAVTPNSLRDGLPVGTPIASAPADNVLLASRGNPGYAVEHYEVTEILSGVLRNGEDDVLESLETN